MTGLTGPGFYLDISAGAYHADPCEEPSLSSSIALILANKTPKHAWQAHPRLTDFEAESTKAMDLGSVAHELLLGKGAGFEICPYDDYRTAAAREWRDGVEEAGKIPIKAEDHAAAEAITLSTRVILSEIQGTGRALIDGWSEMVAIWRDRLGPLCRCRPDRADLEAGVIYDVKTTETGLSDRAINTKVSSDDPGWGMRAAFYMRGIEQLIDEDDKRAPVFGSVFDFECLRYRWIVVESVPPFEARVFELDAISRANGDQKAEAAIRLWHQCLAENRWPGYPRVIEQTQCPDWALPETEA